MRIARVLVLILIFPLMLPRSLQAKRVIGEKA
jgi:hypothetical protein